MSNERLPGDEWWWFWSKVCWVLAGWLGLSLIVSIGLLLGGCNRPPPPAKLPAAKPVAAAPAQPPVEKPAAEEPIESSDVGETPEGDAQEGETPAEPPPREPPAAPHTFATERILILAPRNPLIVELQLSIDGQPHTRAMDALVEEVLKLADTDGDGRPTWKEISESRRFKYGQFGNLPIAGENEFKQIIERYDIDRDGTVDAGELPRFLTRNAGSARPFSVRGTADFRYSVRSASPLWRLLDADDNSAISADERAAAPGRMFTRDTDDDEILLSGDLNPRVPLDMGMGTRVRRGGTTVVRLLGPHASWDTVKLSLEEHYSGSRYLRPDSFALTPELFAQLDANGDGKLLRAEFEALGSVPPHLVIAATFGRPAREEEPSARKGEAPAEPKPAQPETDENNADAPAEPPASPTLKLVALHPAFSDAAATLVDRPGRLTLTIAGSPITFYVNDTVARGDFAAQAQQALAMLDVDKNGYLEASELPASAAPQLGQFEAVDADEDGKVYAPEIIAFLQQQQAGLRAQIHARVSDREDALLAALDQNHDERLDAREVHETPERLAALDTSGDGLLTGDEIPESLVVGLARGNLENLNALFAPPPLVAQAPAADTPRWFTAMDANSDGAISPREFLGPAEKFLLLDTSGDGLLDAVEAKAAQAQ